MVFRSQVVSESGVALRRLLVHGDFNFPQQVQLLFGGHQLETPKSRGAQRDKNPMTLVTSSSSLLRAVESLSPRRDLPTLFGFRGRFAGEVTWITVMTLAFNYLSTIMTCLPLSSFSALSRALRARGTQCLLREGGAQPRVVAAPSLPVRDRLRKRRRGYHGKEVVTAFIFTLAQPSPAFPPMGTAGSLLVLGDTGRDLEWHLGDRLKCRKKDADIVCARS